MCYITSGKERLKDFDPASKFSTLLPTRSHTVRLAGAISATLHCAGVVFSHLFWNPTIQPRYHIQFELRSLATERDTESIVL